MDAPVELPSGGVGDAELCPAPHREARIAIGVVGGKDFRVPYGPLIDIDRGILLLSHRSECAPHCGPSDAPIAS